MAEFLSLITRRALLAALATILALWPGVSARAQDDPLPSWNDGAAKQAILDFVAATTTEGGASFVAPEDRIATFDQDGTTWVEQPLYGQGLFALDRLAAMAPEHPEWKETEPFKSVLTGDHAAMAKFTEKDWMEIVAVTHAGMSTADFETLVADWLPKSKNPVFKRPVTELVYQPMLEVMDYLRDNGFRTYIVTGGGQEFVRVYSEDVYDVPPEQVVGSSIVTKYEMKDGKPVLMREPKVFFVDDGPGKARRHQPLHRQAPADRLRQLQRRPRDAGMDHRRRRRPASASWSCTTTPSASSPTAPPTACPTATIGTFSQALMDEAKARGWTVISMKDDWSRSSPTASPSQSNCSFPRSAGNTCALPMTFTLTADPGGGRSTTDVRIFSGESPAMPRVTMAAGPTISALSNLARMSTPLTASDRPSAICSGRSMIVAGPSRALATGTRPRRQRARPPSIAASRMIGVAEELGRLRVDRG